MSSSSSMKYEETELRLGLPGGSSGGTGKRGFDQTLSKESVMEAMQKLKEANSLSSSSSAATTRPADPAKPPHKTQVVGWPPVRSYRKNVLTSVQPSSSKESDNSAGYVKVSMDGLFCKTQVVGWPPVRSYRKNALTSVQPSSSKESDNSAAAYVKVSMDGAPYLRKVDLKMYKSYHELSDALGKMFSSFTIGNCGSQGMKDFMNESKLIDLLNGSEYVPCYEDEDGDWMLVGDVPWEMFVGSCKRLRIMKGSEAIGLAPRALEKCKSRL